VYYTTFKTPLCDITLAGDNKGLQYLHLHTSKGHHPFAKPDWKKTAAHFTAIEKQIMEYLEGTRRCRKSSRKIKQIS
jgi:methylated-DNA-[protein]-cysteine S-methyltransferase